MNFNQWWSAGSTATNGGLVVLILLMLAVALLAYFGGHRDGAESSAGRTLTGTRALLIALRTQGGGGYEL